MQHLVVIYFFIRTNISRTTRLKLAKNKNNSENLGTGKFKNKKLSSDYLYFFSPLTTNIPIIIETSQLICSAIQLVGFYMMGTLVVKGLKIDLQDIDLAYIYYISLTEATMRSQKLRLTCRELPSSCTPCEYQSELITSAVFFAVST